MAEPNTLGNSRNGRSVKNQRARQSGAAGSALARRSNSYGYRNQSTAFPHGLIGAKFVGGVTHVQEAGLKPFPAASSRA